MIIENIDNPEVSTHSRPKAAADEGQLLIREILVSTHSRPKAAAFRAHLSTSSKSMFQHTAARRRLLTLKNTLH